MHWRRTPAPWSVSSGWVRSSSCSGYRERPPLFPHLDIKMIHTATRDIFQDTIAEMTWFDVEAAAQSGAILLWAFGVIEQHGPHLPTGTDVYIPQAQLRRVKQILDEHDVQALIVPPYYWGINVVSGSFPSSYKVRPEIMKELMSDIFESFRSDGFKQIFCFSGHGDRLHNLTIHEGIQLGAQRSGLDISFVADAALLMRLGIALDDPHACLPPTRLRSAFQALASSPSGPGVGDSDDETYLDVHAGRWETSMMMCSCPQLVNEQVRSSLPSTQYGPDDLAEWRKGFEHARAKTPQGYFGDPAAASVEEGMQALEATAQRAAQAILDRLQRSRKS